MNRDNYYNNPQDYNDHRKTDYTYFSFTKSMLYLWRAQQIKT